MNSSELTAKKATIIYAGLMGMVTIEVSAYRVRTAPFAQHREAVSLAYIKRGRRGTEGVRYTDNVNLVIVEGWDLPDADPSIRADAAECVPDDGASDVVSKYVDALARSGRRILVDFRGHKTNGLGKAPTFAE